MTVMSICNDLPHMHVDSNPPKPLLEIKGLTKSFDGHVAVDGLDLTINQGELFALLGASGCGKSTLLRMLAGFEQPSAGQIILDGEDLAEIPPYRRPVNMMFQSYALFPHMTVADNIAFGLKQDGMSRQEINETVKQMLELVHMSDYAKRKPHQLSGGQKQRVALARSLAKKPKLLLLDEPMGALDKNLREKMQLEVVDILERVGVTCVMVTHDQEEAMTMASRMAIMNKGQFVQIGSPESIYEHPNSKFSAKFVGTVNIFEGILENNQNDSCTVRSQDLEHPICINEGISGVTGVPVMIAVRPEKMTLSTHSNHSVNSCTGVVEDIAYMGNQSIYHVRLPSGKLVTATLQNTTRLRKDMPTWEQKVTLSWEMESCVVLKI
ncbi:putrescine ABC transporter ATP-binding subunit PotG [Vibrio natriegens]|uniref:Spermidine/putrescine import ATP-binding protein PotA n=1 Tax=Vibrio natriegens NBRC 15636 = ATCC 14048 = DSM 759 TaxID=1219067 RepID=A0AAN1CV20_VIBNA|nr:putrescine ABC transporter ATP-binding subunit PotG [Vibrio natriegens]ALR16056.1 transporter [Vibrio natriegens NBRC 15636 = ATCC 14048 = DSM 759]ANQ12082.1 transporter [Vibrio natriegens NBRC 15636 = ATCC 14048 = DSM 759]EPM42556.1 putrescine/spermidine ABC transporter ATP-binding protein [Vibrio natriegens NBRC 15636 = ATCC 14048 = DSM 759]MDX6026444.1 putrescine ABC transporter ATP-binding subunit PotG [Vibrio natriegens NBRC 15636 = ATCC 14048 = DSM 759]UUI12543.1 putrescine ABC transp